MTNLDRIVIYVETSIRVLLHRDRTFGPCAIRFLGRDRCGGVKTRRMNSEQSNAIRSNDVCKQKNREKKSIPPDAAALYFI